VSFVNGPLQRDVTYLDFAFGDAVPRTTRNALLHEESVELDALGRVVTQVDPNGVEVTIVRDALGRRWAGWRRRWSRTRPGRSGCGASRTWRW
jgi:YD repeat-containing protein